MEETSFPQNNVENKGLNNSSQIAGAIIVAGIIIAGAILLKGGSTGSGPTGANNRPNIAGVQVTGIKETDYVLGNKNAKVTVIEYADFQCPFCGRFHIQTEKPLREAYINEGKVSFVYRDFAFLGPESTRAAEAAHCAAEQGKFWEYHDYLYTHQNGENRGAFADANLKTFAQAVSLDTTSFNNCLDSGKYAQTVAASTEEGRASGVTGTPKGYILRNGKLVDTIDGAEPYNTVKAKIDNALK